MHAFNCYKNFCLYTSNQALINILRINLWTIIYEVLLILIFLFFIFMVYLYARQPHFLCYYLSTIKFLKDILYRSVLFNNIPLLLLNIKVKLEDASISSLYSLGTANDLHNLDICNDIELDKRIMETVRILFYRSIL
jgi:hypothetical protein